MAPAVQCKGDEPAGGRAGGLQRGGRLAKAEEEGRRPASVGEAGG